MGLERKLKRMGQFQVVVELANGATIFDSTNKTSDVDEWLASFDKSEHAINIKVYTKDKNGIYGLTTNKSKTVGRPVGFCRGW